MKTPCTGRARHLHLLNEHSRNRRLKPQQLSRQQKPPFIALVDVMLYRKVLNMRMLLRFTCSTITQHNDNNRKFSPSTLKDLREINVISHLCLKSIFHSSYLSRNTGWHILRPQLSLNPTSLLTTFSQLLKICLRQQKTFFFKQAQSGMGLQLGGL